MSAVIPNLCKDTEKKRGGGESSYIQIHHFNHTYRYKVKYFATKIKDSVVLGYINLLKPTGYVMHQQLNIQQLYALLTLYLCVLYLSENKRRLVPLTA